MIKTNTRNWLTFLTFFFCFTTVGLADGDQHWLIEPEAIIDLPRYPYNHEEAEGWYAKEMIVRDWTAGSRHILAIHETATNRSMTLPLAKTIPAGEYKVFIRVMGPTLAEKPTRVSLTFGETKTDFQWQKNRKYKAVWIEPMTVKLDEAADELTITAEQFGGQGYGVMYEPQHRSIWFDTVYVTSNLDAKAPSWEEEQVMRGATPSDALPARPSYPSDDKGPGSPITPSPVELTAPKPVLLRSFDDSKNVWPNGSFEAGLDGGWAFNTRSPKHPFTSKDLTTKSAMHGKLSLAVPAKVEPFTPTRYLQADGQFTLSASAIADQDVTVILRRAIDPSDESFDRKALRSTEAIKLTIPAGKNWQTGSATADLKQGWYFLAFGSTDQGYLLDAIQLEQGSEATPFTPRANVEAGIMSGQPGNIIYPDQHSLPGYIRNDGPTTANVRVSYRIVNVREQVVAESVTDPIAVGASKTKAVDFDIIPNTFGIFSIQYTVAGRDLPEGELVFVRMPTPSDRPTRHELGANISFDPVEMQLQKRLGLDWVLTCKTRNIASASEHAHKEPGKWNFFDEFAKRPAQHGMDQVIGMWPHRVPDFMKVPSTQTRTIRGNKRDELTNIDLWREHVRTITSHYKDDISWWCIDDETEINWDAPEFGTLINATLDEVESAAPGAKVGVSAVPEFQDELLQYVDVDRLGHFGGSTFDFNDLEAQRVAHYQQRYDKPWICYGVGVNQPVRTMYHTAYHFLPAYPKAAHCARRIMNLFLVQDVKVAGHYAGVIRNQGEHESINAPLLDYDGTPIAWGATFGIVGTHLAEAEPLHDVMLGDSPIKVRLFRIGNTLGAATYATNQRAYDLWWRPWPRKVKDLTLQGDLQVRDMYWNPRSDAARSGDHVTFDLTEEPVFILSDDMTLEQFEQVFTNAKLPKRDVKVELDLVANSEGKPLLHATLTNQTAKPMRDVMVDLRRPGKSSPMENAAMHLFTKPVQTVDVIQPGGSATVAFETIYQDKLPIEAGTIRVHVSDRDGFIDAFDDQLWLTNASKQSNVTLDGNLDEWNKATASWLSYNWAWILVSRRQSQIMEGAGPMGNPPYRVDARAAFWAGWDAHHLYLALRLDDDQPLPQELAKFTLGSKQGNAVVTLRPNSKATLTIKGQTTALQTGSTNNTFEVAIPWGALGLSPDAATSIPLDLTWTDADDEDGNITFGTLRWAGLSPRMGTLLIRD